MSKNESGEKKPRNLKKFKYGSMSLIVIVLVIAIVVILNIFTSYLTKRYPIKLDLTADDRYELCDETINALKNLDTDIEIAVVYPEQAFDSLAEYYGVPYDMIPKILEKYQMYAKSGKGSINVEYIDSTKDPDKITKYQNYYNGDISDGHIVIYANEQVKLTHVSQMFSSGSQSYYDTDTSMKFVGESTITSSILAVTNADPVKAALMVYTDSDKQNLAYNQQGSTIYAVSSLENFLKKNGYECEYISLADTEISTEEYDLVVIPAPAYDISLDTVNALEDFLYNDAQYGKSVVYFAGLETASELPNLDEFLAKWNISIGNSVIGDDTNAMSAMLSSIGSAISSPILTIADEEKVGELPNSKLPTIAPYSRTVDVIEKKSEYIVTPLLKTSGSSYLVDLATSDITNGVGECNTAVMTTRELQSGFDVLRSNVLAIGSIFMADNSVLSNTSSYNNANVLLNIINNSVGREAGVIIPQKNLETSTLALTAGQLKGIMVFVVWIIPLIVVAIGLVVLIRRRNR